MANDRSPDATDEIIKSILINNPKASCIKYTNHAVNMGPTPNFMFTLQQAKGRYVAICEGDDYWTDKFKLQKQVDFLKIDIEGAEYEVLKDIEPQLQNVQNLFIEYHGTYEQNKELVEMLTILETNGFSFYIKEATSIYDHPFSKQKRPVHNFDVQLNIFCIRK